MDVSKFIATRSFSSFRKSFTRSIIRLSIGATSLSLAVMIISQSIFNGFQKEIANKVFGFWGHIHITDVQSSRSIEPVTIQAPRELLDSMRSIRLPGSNDPAIRHLQAFMVYPGIAGYKEEFEGLFAKGVGPDFDWDFFNRFLVKGRVQTAPDSPFNKSILISEITANRLKADTGQYLLLNFIVNDELLKRRLKISGIYNTGLAEYDRRFALLDIRLIQQLLKKGPDEATGIEIFCQDILLAGPVNDYLYDQYLPVEWYSETIREKFPNIFEWLSLQDVNKSFILFLILAVCIINMATTVMILILERTQMIGVLTVLGMPRWTQRMIFLRFAARILGWSMLLGNLAGIGLCWLQYHFKWIRLSETDYYLSYAPIDLSLTPVLLLNLIFFLVIILSLILPTWIVQSVKPIQALRFR
ncbi:MAG TPA: FtsX-like permease family protein [Saprospiraceae bacterium]|nr:FtsX-like permease family protein [Saprospiraceae bacterium]